MRTCTLCGAQREESDMAVVHYDGAEENYCHPGDSMGQTCYTRATVYTFTNKWFTDERRAAFDELTGR